MLEVSKGQKCGIRIGLVGEFLSRGPCFPLSSFSGTVNSKQNPLVQFLILTRLGEEKWREKEVRLRHPFLSSHDLLFSELQSEISQSLE